MSKSVTVARAKIISALDQQPSTFTQLLEKTEMSRPTLSKHLKRMKSIGIVRRRIDRRTEDTVYTLTKKAADSNMYRLVKVRNASLRSLLSAHSHRFERSVVSFISPSSNSLDEEVLDSWIRRIGLLAVYTMLQSILIGNRQTLEAETEWFSETFMDSEQRALFRFLVYLRLLSRRRNGSMSVEWDKKRTNDYLRIISEGKKPKDQPNLEGIIEKRVQEMLELLRELNPEEFGILENVYSKSGILN